MYAHELIKKDASFCFDWRLGSWTIKRHRPPIIICELICDAIAECPHTHNR